MKKLLFDERPLVVNPELACHIGLHEAIILQQVHYWVVINAAAKKNERDGHYWTFNSYPEWRRQFPFWSTRTIQRLIRSLEERGLLISGNYNKLGIDRTKWYRIDYDNLSLWKATICPGQNAEVSQPLPETTTETTIESITAVECFDFALSKEQIGLIYGVCALPRWKLGDDDGHWLIDFQKEFPSITLADIKACRDYHDGRVASHKGVWKNRLRNWMKNKKERGDGKVRRHSQEVGAERLSASIGRALD